VLLKTVKSHPVYVNNMKRANLGKYLGALFSKKEE
jgi:hypothetical protein